MKETNIVFQNVVQLLNTYFPYVSILAQMQSLPVIRDTPTAEVLNAWDTYTAWSTFEKQMPFVFASKENAASSTYIVDVIKA